MRRHSGGRIAPSTYVRSLLRNTMAQLVKPYSRQKWGKWNLHSDLCIKHREVPYLSVNFKDINNSLQLLQQVTVKSSVVLMFIERNQVPADAQVCTTLAVAMRDILLHSGINLEKHAQFSGQKAVKKFFLDVVAVRNVPPKRRIEVLEKYKFRCAYCGASAADGASLEVDHIIPVSKGGSNELSNLQTLCKSCNVGKSDRIISFHSDTDGVHPA